MSSSTARYAVGIDLGTTNSAVSWIDLSVPTGPGRPPVVRSFPVPQLVGEGNVADRTLLPSFLYLAGPADLPAGSLRIPWDEGRGFAVGEFGRNQGAKLPARLVSSAKSWLCHTGVDRTASILPWGAPTEMTRVSPVEASARYLAHMREAWNFRMAAGGQEELRLENQDVVLTVPASFDAVARELTVEAARRAGLPKVTLLEEPQAAFYWWIVAHYEAWWDHVKPGTLVLVCDVGGGTTDFSLIAVTESKKGLGFQRFAVGDHLILGGDNMDVALARSVESRLAGGKPAKLDIVQWSGLVQACRAAKEKLLSGKADKVPVVLAGRGSSVIGGSLRAELTAEEVQRVVVEGFLPRVAWEDEPKRGGRTGLQEFGLPYATDPAIPKHLSSFLRRHLGTPDAEGRPRGRVSAVLFNGGVFNPPVMRNRLMEVLNGWLSTAVPFGEITDPQSEGAEGAKSLQLAVLENRELDLAVAHGAAYYGLVRRGKGIRIGGGTARSYYVGISAGAPAAEAAATSAPAAAAPAPTSEAASTETPATDAPETGTGTGAGGEAGADPSGIAPPDDAGGPPPDALVHPSATRTTVLCVAPAGLEEGSEIEITDRRFELLTGRPVGFRLFCSSLRPKDKLGELMVAEDESLVPLAPLRTVLSAGKKGGARTIPVHLRTRITEVGTLELYCVGVEGGKSWRLQFQVRNPMLPKPAGNDTPADDGPGEDAVDAGVALDEGALTAAEDVVRAGFGLPAKGTAPAGEPVMPAQLIRRLEEVLDHKRGRWPTSALRRLWEPLFETMDARKQTAEHETRWLNLAGFCLRPGFGDPLDEWRLKRLWGVNYSGLQNIKHPQAWVEWWTLWRRVSGGLTSAWQGELYNELAAYLHLSLRKGKGQKAGRVKPTPHETAEMWRLAGSLERLDASLKEKLGNAVWLESGSALPGKHLLFALARVGARVPLYGPVNTVVPARTAEVWLGRLLGMDWTAEAEGAAFAAAQLARMTGDRALDVDEGVRKRVLEKLATVDPAKVGDLAESVREVVARRSDEKARMFGEELPAGLRLVK